jgi:hypothetical protein
MAQPPSTEELNPLCEKCVRPCRQPLGTKLVECPRFSPRPFKLAAPPRKQLDLF